MSKNILQDIKPLSRSSQPKQMVHEEHHDDREIQYEKKPPVYSDDDHSDDYDTPPRHSHKTIWIVAGVVLVVLALALSHLFSGAKVSVTPKSQHLVFDDTSTLSAKSVASDTDLSFELVSLDDSVTASAPATSTHNVEVKATGVVVMYNTLSTSQPLKIDTRLSTKDGKIYKTKKAITVPAQKVVAGKSVPGSIEVAIYADVAGPDYNITASDFSVVGFKGTSKADKIYARGKGPVTGGSKGLEANISDTDLSASKDAMNKELKDKLLAKAIAQVPTGFLYYPDGVFYDIHDTPTVSKVEGGSATLENKGTITIILFSEGKLTRYLAKKMVSQYDGADVTLDGLHDLVFALKNKDLISTPKDAKDISFTLKGEGTVVWSVDTESLRDTLVNKKKKDFQTILQDIPSIESAEVHMSPVWQSTFPQDKKDITVTLVK
jgi:hypothetical protein